MELFDIGIHDDFDQFIEDILASIANLSSVYISGKSRTGKSTVLCTVYSRLKSDLVRLEEVSDMNAVVITSCNERSNVAMRKTHPYYSIPHKKTPETRYLLIDNVNMMSTSALKRTVEYYPNARVIVAGNPEYRPRHVDMTVLSEKWKIHRVDPKVCSKISTHQGQIQPSRQISLVKGEDEMEKWNVSRGGTILFSRDQMYVESQGGVKYEMEDVMTSHYLNLTVYTQHTLKLAVGDTVLFKSNWMMNYNEIGTVKSISKSEIIVTCNGIDKRVVPVDEEGRVSPNVVVVRRQFPIVLANAIDIRDMEGLYLGNKVMIRRTESWTAGDVEYALAHCDKSND